MRENLLKAFITTSVLWIYPIETAFLTKMPGQTVKSGTQTLASQELGSRFGQLAGFRAFSTDDKDLTNLNRIAELGESQKNLANQENENKNSLFSPLQTKYKKYSENLPAVKNGEYGSKDFFNAPLSRQAGLTAENDGDNVVKLGINKKGRLQLFVGGSENLNTESFKEQIRASALRNKHYYLPRFKFAEDAFADMPIGDGLADLLKDFDHVNMRQEEDAWYNLEIRSHMEKAMKELKELKKLYPDTSYANYKDFQLKEVDKVEIDSKVAVAAAELKAALSGIAKLDDRRFIPPMLEKSFYIKKNFKTINFLIEKKLISPSDALRWFREDDTLKILAYHFDKEIDVSPTQHWLPTKDAFLKDHRNLGASLSVLEEEDWKLFLHEFNSLVNGKLIPEKYKNLKQISDTFKTEEFFKGLDEGSESVSNTVKSLVKLLDSKEAISDEQALATHSIFVNRNLNYVRSYANPKALGEYSTLKNGLIAKKLDALDLTNELIPLSVVYDEAAALRYAFFTKINTAEHDDLYLVVFNRQRKTYEQVPRKTPTNQELADWTAAIKDNTLEKNPSLKNDLDILKRHDPDVKIIHQQIKDKIDKIATTVKQAPPAQAGELRQWLNFPNQHNLLGLTKSMISPLNDEVKAIDDLKNLN